MQDNTLLASVDLGSNSFRLEVGKFEHGQIQRMEYLKETVRQGGGLDEEKMLSLQAMQRGWDCLARFAERIANFEPQHVRAVATQTLREAKNRDVFIQKANEILGFPIDIIAGREEARLIYLGVAHMLPQSDEKRLVIDIGGRSTELILGQGYQSLVTESYQIGSVGWSMKYFANGDLSAKAFDKARVAACALLGEAASLYPRSAWQIAYGSSGTASAVADVLAAAGFAPGVIDRAGLHWLLERLIKAGHADKLHFDGLREERKAVIGGGLSTLLALFDVLGLEELHISDGALRQGVLYDLLDRELDETDTRAATVARLAKGFGVDLQQAQCVRASALYFYEQLQPSSSQKAHSDAWRLLGWAAELHEIGTRISHNYFHKHGAYILENADAAGFTETEQSLLGLLVLGQRGKLRKLEVNLHDLAFVQKLLCLRLASIVCHARNQPDIAALRLQQQKRGFKLLHSAAWQHKHPQSYHLLVEEAAHWQRAGWGLDLQLN